MVLALIAGALAVFALLAIGGVVAVAAEVFVVIAVLLLAICEVIRG
jgi:hypothetical protein